MPAELGTIALTILALIAFASNSLLTRMALGAHQIDAATFTSIRLVAGAVVLAVIVRAQAGTFKPLGPNTFNSPLVGGPCAPYMPATITVYAA